MSGYSNLMHSLFSKAVKQTDDHHETFYDIISMRFVRNDKVDYLLQYKYRSKDISFYFLKEFFAALCMTIVLQIINNSYVQDF